MIQELLALQGKRRRSCRRVRARALRRAAAVSTGVGLQPVAPLCVTGTAPLSACRSSSASHGQIPVRPSYDSAAPPAAMACESSSISNALSFANGLGMS